MSAVPPTQLRLAVNWTVLDRTIAEESSPRLFTSQSRPGPSPRPISRYRWLLGPLVLAIILGVTPAVGQEPLVIRLHDGTVLRGQLDSRTGDQALVVRWQRTGVEIRRAIPWSHVDNVSGSEGPRDRVELAATARQLPVAESRRDIPKTLVVPPATEPGYQANGWNITRQPPTERPQLADLELDVRIANWDSDPASDGLELRVTPIGRDGTNVAARGTLSAEFFAEYRIDQDSAPHGRGSEVRSLGKWNLQVPANPDAAGSILRLPWNRSEPELDSRWASHGRLHVEFAVPGEGVMVRDVHRIRIRVTR